MANQTATAPPRSRKGESSLVHDRVKTRQKRLLWRFTSLSWFLADLLIAFSSVFLAYVASPHESIFDFIETSATRVPAIPYAIAFSLLVGTLAHIAALHDPRYPRRLFDVIGRAAIVVALAFTLITVLQLLIQFVTVGRYVIVFGSLFTLVGMTVVRRTVWYFSSNLAQTVCFLGDDRFCFNSASFLDYHPLPFNTKTILDFTPGDHNNDLSQWAVNQDIDEIVYDVSSRMVEDESLLKCLDEGIRISSYPDFVESNYFMVPVEEIGADWLFNARLELAHPYFHGIKRILDAVAGVIGLVLTAPVLGIAMILIKLEDSGPALYSQVRVGQFNRKFRIYKLRTMRQDAEKDGAKWASQGDNRITRIGRILRKTRLDEAPQFWNIVKGDMSLVGPRPERPEFVGRLGDLIPFYVQRHLVKPGLTGWAQINYPYGSSVEDAIGKLKYDLYYVKRSSVGLDLQVVLRTVGAIMKGAR